MPQPPSWVPEALSQTPASSSSNIKTVKQDSSTHIYILSTPKDTMIQQIVYELGVVCLNVCELRGLFDLYSVNIL
jgi:hypothetical protein